MRTAVAPCYRVSAWDPDGEQFDAFIQTEDSPEDIISRVNRRGFWYWTVTDTNMMPRQAIMFVDVTPVKRIEPSWPKLIMK